MSGDVALNPLAEVTVFRMIQECLTNVQKHANASHMEVSLQVMSESLEVKVKDSGQGFDPHAVASIPTWLGLGLRSMQERAEELGGSLSVKSSPGSGCQIVLNIPSKEAEVGAHSNLSGG